MTTEPLQLDELSEPHVQIMQAYSVRAAAGKSAEDFDGWLERVSVLADFTPEQLVQRHGELIALGFLKFEISNADLGLRYQISPRGKQALERAVRRASEQAAVEPVEDTVVLTKDAQTTEEQQHEDSLLDAA